MSWHAGLDRATDQAFRSAAAWKRHDQIGVAFVEHPLIAQLAGFLPKFVPLAQDLIWLARKSPPPRPIISKSQPSSVFDPDCVLSLLSCRPQ